MAEKTVWKPGNLVVPAPAALVSCQDRDGRPNLITIAWTGNINSDPAMASISVRPERYSHGLILESGEFVLNFMSLDFAKSTDYCGVVSGRDVDKWEATGLTPCPVDGVSCPGVKEAPINVACRLTERVKLGSHDLFLAEIVSVAVDSKLIDRTGRFHLEKANLLCFAHGNYYALGPHQGHFGWSVRKKKAGGKAKK
ncbi:MAG: flavin reductase family protein [Planctomycetes bacterium]|nr:flavin reductase family protein [Planctomycetota bacterium]